MHWIIVASQKEARIFIKKSNRKQLTLLNSIVNPLGQVRKKNLIRKEAGRGVKSFGRIGSVSYSEPKRHDPKEEATSQFARELSRYLESEMRKKSFDTLSVVAEPRLLGKIRTEMKTPLQKSVTHWIKKDLQKTPAKDLTDFLIPKTEDLSP